jgi:hypothetical protein
MSWSLCGKGATVQGMAQVLLIANPDLHFA